MFAGRPFPPLSFPSFPSPRSGASRPHNHRPGSPAPRSLRARTLRSRPPAEAVSEVPSLCFLEEGKNKKEGRFLAIQKNQKNQKKVVATSFLNFKNYYKV